MHIPARFNGPPGSGNGGWCAGVFAVAAGAAPGGAARQVTLRLPPPLEAELEVRTDPGYGGAGPALLASVYAGSDLIAEIAEAAEAGPGVDPVPWETAVAAARDYPGLTDHPFPTCFVCGPERAEGDGLRIFPGPLPDGRTAAPWTVPGEVSVPLLWAALDCPGGWTAIKRGQAYVLGRITAAVEELPEPGARCVVTGAVSELAGRKALVDSAIHGSDGRRLAVARAVWIRIR